MSETQDSDATHDHMGRKIVESSQEAFRQDVPWIIGMVLLTAFTLMALAGFFRF